MRKYLVLAFGLTAIAILAVGTRSASAGSSPVGFISRPSEAADLKGDNNAIGRFNRHEANKRLFKIHGTVTVLSNTSITIMSKKGNGDSSAATSDTSYTFSIDSTTKVIRRFRATSSVAEMTVGDQVKIWATKLTDGNAQLIWDKSIWWVRQTGTVSALDAVNQTFTLLITRKASNNTTKTFSLSVKTNDLSIYTMADGTAGTWSMLANGDLVRVRGVWNHIGRYLTARNIRMVE